MAARTTTILFASTYLKTVARKVRFCGYLDIEPRAVSREDIRHALKLAEEPLVLVTIGNGRVGFPVLDAYVRALECLPNDLVIFSMIVAGPELAPCYYEVIDRQCQLSARQNPRKRTRLIRFSPRFLDYMAAADLVISLAGYNTVAEILRLEKRAIVIPYTSSTYVFYRQRAAYARVVDGTFRPDPNTPPGSLVPSNACRICSLGSPR